MMNTRERTSWHRRAETLGLSLGLLATPLTFAQEAAPTKALPLTPSAALAPAQQLSPGHSVRPFAPGSQFYDKIQKPSAQARAALAPLALEAQPVESNTPLILEVQSASNGQQSIDVTPEQIEQTIQAQAQAAQEEQAQAVQTPAPVQAQLRSFQSASVTAATTAATTFTPLCPTLSINTLYTMNGMMTGDAACYHFQITARSKSTAILTGQTAGTDMALYLMKDDGANNVTVIGASNNAGTADEAISVFTEPGNYYWYIEAGAANGNPFNFGVAVNTAGIDPYEPNDTPAQATVLPDRFNTIYGNADSAADVDYYQFTAVRGQTVFLGLKAVNPSINNNWILELQDGGWQPITTGTGVNIPNLAAQQSITVRVRPNPAAVPSPTMQYQLMVGSTPVSSAGGAYGYGNNNFQGIPGVTTQTIRDISWYINFKDSRGVVVPGVEAQFVLRFPIIDPNNLDAAPKTAYPAFSDFAGNAGTIVNLGSCSGHGSIDLYDAVNGYTWHTLYELGQWSIAVPYFPDLGVGGSSYPSVLLGQICSQYIVH